MEHLLLGGVPAGDELHVVHEEHVGAPVFFPEFGVAALSNGLDQLIGEGVPLDVDNLVNQAKSIYDKIENLGADGIFDKIGSFFSNLFSSIADFFKNLFN